MIFRKIYIIPIFFIIIFFLLSNLYFMHILFNDAKDLHIEYKPTTRFINEIVKKAQHLGNQYTQYNYNSYKITEQLVSYFKPNQFYNKLSLSEAFQDWPKGNKLYPENNTIVGSLLHFLSTSKIISSDVSSKGTQLKLLLTLEGNIKAIFKPRWYERNSIIEGPVYAGKDRDNAEILAFYLAAMLGLNSAPIAISRKLTRKELSSTQIGKLKKTMFYNDEGQYCFYGKCRYCTIKEPVCEDDSGGVDGVMIQYLNLAHRGGLLLKRSPWQRTYKDTIHARWEIDQTYCESVKNEVSQTRLLDLVDMAIVDFLLQNGDRHHYETFEDRTILLDNGKGLGNPYVDHIDILAPFYQCCMIRSKTWEHLLLFAGGSMSRTINTLIANEPLNMIVTKPHLEALDRRLKMIYSTYEICKNRISREILK